jgi:O-methyltransferase involved in polyketide biosynthesis
MKSKIMLDKEAETLLIPLYGRAVMSREGKIIHDVYAEEIIGKIDYDFTSLKIPRKVQVFMSIRGAIIDEYVNHFLNKNPESLVVYLGCGLDSRFYRLDNGSVSWYDLDFPEVISLKSRLFHENERYTLIASSVTDFSWFNKILKSDLSRPTLIIAEGLLMYLSEDQVEELFLMLRDSFINSTFILDAYSKTTAKYAKHQKSLKNTGAHIKWGVNGPREIESFGYGITHIETKYLTDFNLKSLNRYFSFMFAFAGKFKLAKEAHRIFTFSLRK